MTLSSLTARYKKPIWRAEREVVPGPPVGDFAHLHVPVLGSNTASPVLLVRHVLEPSLIHSCRQPLSVRSRPPIVSQRNEILPVYLTFEPQHFRVFTSLRTYVLGVVVAGFKRDIEIFFRPFRRMTRCYFKHLSSTSYLEPFNTFQRWLGSSYFGRYLDHAWREQTCRLILRIRRTNRLTGHARCVSYNRSFPFITPDHSRSFIAACQA